MSIQINKFNIINKLLSEDTNYSSIIKTYLENFLELDINIYHPDYIYQIIWNNKINNSDLIVLYNYSISNILIKKRQYIRNLLKKEKFNLQSLNQLISNLNNKILKIKNILLIEDNNNSNINFLLSDPLLINYLENNILNLDNNLHNNLYDNNNLDNNLDNNNKKNIEILINFLLKFSIQDYNWFLKLIGSVLRNNINTLSITIPEKYKKLYELYNLIDYVNNISNIYKFLKESILILLNPLYEIILLKFIDCTNNCTIHELLNLIDNNTTFIKHIFNKNKNIACAINNNLNIYINNINTYDDNEILLLLKLIIKCNDLDLLDKYILLIFENEKIIKIIIDIIHETIYTDILFIKNIINLLKIKNKDIFMNAYHLLLIKRILSDECNISFEQIIIKEILIIFGKKISNKSYKVINDYVSSIDNNKNYQNICNINIFSTITTSYSNWDINYNEGYVTIIDDELSNDITESKSLKIKNNKLIDLESYISNYQYFYNNIYNNKRKLLWILQYGEIDITYENYNIKLLPIQLMVLELFNIKYEFSFDEIINQSFFINYSNVFKEDIINSLLISNILIKNDDKIFLNENTSNISLNLIEIYMSNKNTNFQDLQINIVNNLAYEREDIVKTLINHNLKLNSIDKDILFSKLENNILSFKLSSKIYDDTIDKMIKYDYITIENNILTKCLY